MPIFVSSKFPLSLILLFSTSARLYDVLDILLYVLCYFWLTLTIQTLELKTLFWFDTSQGHAKRDRPEKTGTSRYYGPIPHLINIHHARMQVGCIKLKTLPLATFHPWKIFRNFPIFKTPMKK